MTAHTTCGLRKHRWLRRPTDWLALFAAAFAWLTGGCAAKHADPALETTRAVEHAEEPFPGALETFDAAWATIDTHHYDPNHGGVDWQAVRDELRPKVEAGVSEREMRFIIQDMIERLGESHFALIPREIAYPDEYADAPDGMDTTDEVSASDDSDQHAAASVSDSSDTEAAGRGELAMRWKMIDGRVIVSRVDPDGAVAQQGVQPGWIIDEIDGVDINHVADRLYEDLDSRLADAHLNEVIQQASRGDVGSSVEVTFLDLHDEPHALTLERSAAKGQVVRLGNLPPFAIVFESEELDRDSLRIGVIRFNLWVAQMAGPIHEAMDRFRGLDGVIVDLRGNPGGVGAMAMGVAGHFFGERTPLGTMKTRDTTLEFFANPRRTTATGDLTTPFAGPLVILTDGMTASTSEIFAGGIQANGRAEIIGEPTMGAALPARMDVLPNGDVLLNAFADFVDANGVRLEGRGVIPDQHVLTTRYDLIEGHDPVMEAALSWIQQQQADASLGTNG